MGEVTLLARTLLTVSELEWPDMAARILRETRLAANFVQATGRPHPQLGDGTIMSRCLRLCPVAEPFCDDPSVLRAVRAACTALLDHSFP